VRTYPPDAFPVVWDHMDSLAATGSLLVPEEVYEELGAQDDELLAWVKQRSSTIVMLTTRAVMLEARAILADHEALTKTGLAAAKQTLS